MTNPHHILGIEPGARPEAIKAAYRRLVLKYHPDRNPAPEAAQQFLRIQKAYEALSNSKPRTFQRVPTQSRYRAEPHSKPYEDPRKYGTHKTYTRTNPEELRKQKRYKQYCVDYALFSKSGMKLPRALWLSRFREVWQEALRSYHWMIGISLVLPITGSILLFLGDRSAIVFNCFLIGAIICRGVLVERAPKSLAKRKAGVER